MLTYEGRVCQPPKGYITIVVARFNKSITQKLLDGAILKLRQHNVQDRDIRVVWVPGAYELPFVSNYFARDMECLAVIALGAVIKGETSHDQHINRSVSMALGEISNRFGTPVIFGVITCESLEQAEARSGMTESAKDKKKSPAPGNKGAEAAEAALEMIDLLTELPEIQMIPMPPLPKGLSQLLSKHISSLEIKEVEDDDSNDDMKYEDIDRIIINPQTKKNASKKPVKKATKKAKNEENRKNEGNDENDEAIS
ncbi:MAG: 6,7-dimethyl-8-ribityllumazine synthase [Thermoguttaceae bacterium]